MLACILLIWLPLNLPLLSLGLRLNYLSSLSVVVVYQSLIRLLLRNIHLSECSLGRLPATVIIFAEENC